MKTVIVTVMIALLSFVGVNSANAQHVRADVRVGVPVPAGRMVIHANNGRYYHHGGYYRYHYAHPYYGYRRYYYHEDYRVWVPGYWSYDGYWIPGHWEWR